MKLCSVRIAWTVAGFLAVCGAASKAAAWHGDGHVRIAGAAFEAAGTNLPPFFLQQRDVVLHCSQDPDMFRHVPYPELPAQENPEHFLDVEMLQGADMPPTRPEYVTLCREKGVNPYECGFLPYAVLEWTERLIVAFAEHRAAPEDSPAALKCAVYAGILSHYAADLDQPLHTTLHYDGRSADGRTSPRTGIHGKVDALAGKVEMPADFLAGAAARPYTNFQAAVFAEFRLSNRHVETVYRIEPHMPPAADPNVADEELRAFALERVRSASLFTADLLLTAWQESAALRLPPWRVWANPRPAADKTTGKGVDP